MSVNLFDLSAYDYNLPEGLIAQYPLEKRDQAKLMVIDRKTQTITHDTFANLNDWLPKKSLMVLNDSKVIAARLTGRKKDTEGEVEVFLLNATEDDQTFEALLRPLKRIKEGQLMDFGQGLEAVLVDREKRIVRFNKKDVLNVIAKQGHIPLPPYIKRADEASDRINYQTVYAKHLGSVAAPTAGLHFTEDLMKQLKASGHDFAKVTLHINYGTFKPVETDDIRNHPMHEEFYHVEKDEYTRIKKHHPIVAVGTTASRTLESIAQGRELEDKTNIFIYPGYTFKSVDALITNFHLPKSTLLMLVSAFAGYELMHRAYQKAISQKYRFYSYGDAMLIL
jgi:S-adenosylmethionine:tRNA ribosyltransferase-isomerase